MTNADIRFIPNREVREIPKGWQHPKDAHGSDVPMLPAPNPVLTVGRELTGYRFADEDGASARMPDVSGLPDDETEIVAYETTTEGSPISPAFPNTPDGRLALVNYCAGHATTYGRNHADAEAWAAIFFGDATIGIDGTVRA